MPKKKVHRLRRVRIYSFCFIDSVVPENILECCSNGLYNLWKELYRHPSLPSPIKKFVLRNSLKIFGTKRFLETENTLETSHFQSPEKKGGGFW